MLPSGKVKIRTKLGLCRALTLTRRWNLKEKNAGHHTRVQKETNRHKESKKPLSQESKRPSATLQPLLAHLQSLLAHLQSLLAHLQAKEVSRTVPLQRTTWSHLNHHQTRRAPQLFVTRQVQTNLQVPLIILVHCWALLHRSIPQCKL